MIKFSTFFYLNILAIIIWYFKSPNININSLSFDDCLKIMNPFWLVDLFKSDELFTADELAKHNGVKRPELYIAILGKVYDVTKGKKYYGQGESYHGFVGRDGSRAFITGIFTNEGLTDDVADLPIEELRGLQHWTELYEKNYEYKGKLIGRYYNSGGSPTEYLRNIQAKFEERDAQQLALNELDRKYPPCNLEFHDLDGSIVWCSKRSGGIQRSWAGFPRKFFPANYAGYRCACIESENSVDVSDGKFVSYGDCKPNAEKCYLKMDSDD